MVGSETLQQEAIEEALPGLVTEAHREAEGSQGSSRRLLPP